MRKMVREYLKVKVKARKKERRKVVRNPNRCEATVRR